MIKEEHPNEDWKWGKSDFMHLMASIHIRGSILRVSNELFMWEEPHNFYAPWIASVDQCSGKCRENGIGGKNQWLEQYMIVEESDVGWRKNQQLKGRLLERKRRKRG